MSRVRWWKRYDEMPVVELQKSNPVRFGVIVIVITAIVVYFGFTKHIPFKHGFRLKAVFGTAVNISPKSPVRIAGVNVGTVNSIKREGNTGVVTMEITKGGLPIHRDATLKIRARILLEGNWFVDLQPGTPNLADGLLGLHDPDHPDLGPGPARSGPRRAEHRHARQSADASGRIRLGADTQADRRARTPNRTRRCAA